MNDEMLAMELHRMTDVSTINLCTASSMPDGNRLTDKAVTILTACSKLESLNIGGNSLTMDGVLKSLMMPLRKLDIRNATMYVAFVSIGEVSVFKNGSILHLDVSNCKLTDSSVLTIVQAMPQLVCLDVSTKILTKSRTN